MTRLKRPVAKLIVLLCACLAFVGAGVWMLTLGERDAFVWGWVAIAFFGAGAIAFLVMLFGDIGLLIDADGFEVRMVFRRKRYSWTAVSEFSIMHVQSASEIMFDDLTIMDRAFARLTRFFLGRNSSIPGVLVSGPIEEACALFNEWRGRAFAKAGLPLP